MNNPGWTWSYDQLTRDFQKAFCDLDVEFELTCKKINKEFNVEGLAYHPVAKNTGILYVGLRAPLTHDGQALILGYQLDANHPSLPRRFTTHQVNLNGLGIRGLDWDSKCQRLMIVAGVSTNEDAEKVQPSVLIAFDPKTASHNILQTFAGYSGEPEAVTRAPSGRLLVLFDGKNNADRGGVYVLE